MTKLASIILFMSFAVSSMAKEVKLTWDSNSEPDIAGYKLHYGNSSRSYADAKDIPGAAQQPEGKLNLPVGKWYIAVTAYNAAGMESGYSNEVSIDVGPPNITNCDPNADGVVDALDIQLVINAVLGSACTTCDIIADGNIDALDVQLIINVVLGKSQCP